MIPPSAALIVFGIIAQQSIGTLFTAAIIPGITQTLLYFAVVWIWCGKARIAPPMERASWPDRLAAVKRIADVSLLIVIMIGGIVVGWFSPSEAASVGVVGVLIICAVRRRLGWAMLRHAFEETLSTSGLIFAIIIGALIFAVFMSVTGVATSIGLLIADLEAGRLSRSW